MNLLRKVLFVCLLASFAISQTGCKEQFAKVSDFIERVAGQAKKIFAAVKPAVKPVKEAIESVKDLVKEIKNPSSTANAPSGKSGDTTTVSNPNDIDDSATPAQTGGAAAPSGQKPGTGVSSGVVADAAKVKAVQTKIDTARTNVTTSLADIEALLKSSNSKNLTDQLTLIKGGLTQVQKLLDKAKTSGKMSAEELKTLEKDLQDLQTMYTAHTQYSQVLVGSLNTASALVQNVLRWTGNLFGPLYTSSGSTSSASAPQAPAKSDEKATDKTTPKPADNSGNASGGTSGKKMTQPSPMFLPLPGGHWTMVSNLSQAISRFNNAQGMEKNPVYITNLTPAVLKDLVAKGYLPPPASDYEGFVYTPDPKDPSRAGAIMPPLSDLGKAAREDMRQARERHNKENPNSPVSAEAGSYQEFLDGLIILKKKGYLKGDPKEYSEGFYPNNGSKATDKGNTSPKPADQPVVTPTDKPADKASDKPFTSENAPSIAEPTISWGLTDAARGGNLSKVKKILDKDPVAVKERDQPPYASALNWAAQYGHVEVMKELVTRGCSINDAKNANGDTPLHTAAGNRMVDSVQWLVKQGASLEARNAKGETPLQAAAKAGRWEVVKALLDAGAKIDSVGGDPNGLSPLMIAIQSKEPGADQVVKNLIQSKANLEAKDKIGNTPLMWAIIRQDVAAVKLLLESGANARAERTGNPSLATPIQQAQFTKNEEIILLVKIALSQKK